MRSGLADWETFFSALLGAGATLSCIIKATVDACVPVVEINR